jgi:hypothetical protein
MADPERLELPTPAFEAQCSIQLSYGSDFFRRVENTFIVILERRTRSLSRAGSEEYLFEVRLNLLTTEVSDV